MISRLIDIPRDVPNTTNMVMAGFWIWSLQKIVYSNRSQYCANNVVLCISTDLKNWLYFMLACVFIEKRTVLMLETEYQEATTLVLYNEIS